MAEIVNTDCFVGKHQLALSCYSDALLQSYIDRYEDYYLCHLLGSELKDLLIADLVDGVPVNPEYLEWFNSFCMDSDCCCSCCPVQSWGLKDMLTGFIYYHYVKDTQIKHTGTGMVVNNNENSTPINFHQLSMTSSYRYNESLDSYKAIRMKIDGCCQRKCSLEKIFLDIL